MPSTIRFCSFPRTEAPPAFAQQLVEVFLKHEPEIATVDRSKGLTSDQTLAVMAGDLEALGFEVETGKRKADKIDRPVFFGEQGQPTLRYEIDAHNDGWKCGLEIEAGRGVMGNAIYRDLIQAAVMVGVEYLCLAVANEYKYKSGGKVMVSRDYERTFQVVEAVYGHSRIKLPYRLLLIGY